MEVNCLFPIAPFDFSSNTRYAHGDGQITASPGPLFLSAVIFLCTLICGCSSRNNSDAERAQTEQCFFVVASKEQNVSVTMPESVVSKTKESLGRSRQLDVQVGFSVIGKLQIVGINGASRELIVFSPWGYYSENGKQYETDLSMIKNEVAASIESAALVLNDFREESLNGSGVENLGDTL